MKKKPTYAALERRLRIADTALDHLNSGVAIFEVIHDGEDVILKYVNKAVENVEKVKAENVLGRSGVEVFRQMKDSGLYDALIRVWKTGAAEHFPTVLYRDERISGWRDSHIKKISPTKVIVVYTDETEIKEAEHSLRASELFFQSVFDTIQDGITVLDPQMNILKMNRAMELWYQPKKPYLGKKCYEVYHHRKSTCDGCPAQKAIDTGRFHTKTVPRGGPAGTPGWIELSSFPIISPEGETLGAVEYVRNITARKAAQDALKNSERKLKEIIEFLPDPTWVIDKKGVVIQWNHALEQLTGVKAEDIIGKGNYAYAMPLYGERRPVLIDLVLKPDEKWEKEYSYLEKTGDVYTNIESHHPTLGKKGVYLSATASPLYDANGEVVGAIESVRDITERRNMEQEKEKVIKEELDKALSNVKLLRGLIPICASCKNIRDDDGYWKQIEEYIRNHTEVEFSHGICPQCYQKLYAGLEMEKE